MILNDNEVASKRFGIANLKYILGFYETIKTKKARPLRSILSNSESAAWISPSNGGHSRLGFQFGLYVSCPSDAYFLASVHRVSTRPLHNELPGIFQFVSGVIWRLSYHDCPLKIRGLLECSVRWQSRSIIFVFFLREMPHFINLNNVDLSDIVR